MFRTGSFHLLRQTFRSSRWLELDSEIFQIPSQKHTRWPLIESLAKERWPRVTAPL